MASWYLSWLPVPLALVACAHAHSTVSTAIPSTMPTPEAPRIELTLTAPIETSLAVPGVSDTRAAWLGLLQGARRSIDLSAFYLSDAPGEGLSAVITALRDAAARGVRVRILVDRRFYAMYSPTVIDLDARPGIEARVLDYGPHGGVQHAKYMVIDGARAWLGSANFDWRALAHIHEVGVSTTAPSIARSLSAVFARDWSEAHREDPRGDTVPAPGAMFPCPADATITLVASPQATTPPGVGDSLRALVSALDGARVRVSVQVYEYALRGYTPEGVPWTVLDDALRRAAARGVAVRLLVDATALVRGGAELHALAGIHGITVRTVTIPRWSGGEIPFARLAHSKYMVVDDTLAWVGTENWTPAYFVSSRNVGVMLRDQPTLATLAAIFQQVWDSAYVTSLAPLP